MFKNAVTGDFIDLTRSVCGNDMNWFFNEWLYHPDHPVYSNFYDIQKVGAGSWNLKFLMTQTQTTTVFFKMPVQIRVVFSDSTDTLIQFINDTNHQLFEFTFPKRPVEVIFDPYRNILLKTATTTLGIGLNQSETGFRLFQNEPNPFSDRTLVTYLLPAACSIRITLLDASGKELLVPFEGYRGAGTYSFLINGKDLLPGVYFCKLEAGKFNEIRKMIRIN